MATKKKTTGGQSVIDPSVGGFGFSDPNRGHVFGALSIGTGFDDTPTTIKDTTQQPIEQQPLTGTFTDVKTGRPSGIATPQGTFFVQGSDLELLKQQQLEKTTKEGLSGSEKLGGTIAEAAAQRATQAGQLQAAQTTGQAGQIPSMGGIGFLGREFFAKDLSNVRLMRQAKEGNIVAAQMLGLNELDVQTLQQGKAEINAFSQFIEAIPLVGKLRTPRALGFSIGIADITGKSPSGKIDDLLRLMQSNVNNAVDYANTGINNPALADFYTDEIKEIEQEVLLLESRIKLLSIQSPSVQSEPENSDLLMAQIQNHKNTLTISKLKLGIV